MARISVLVLVLVVVAMVTLSLSVASVSAQTSHRNCFRFVSSYKFNQRVWYVMNICSCSLRAQVVNIGLSPATTNTTVLNIPAWDGTKNTRNIVALPPLVRSVGYPFGGSQAFGAECMPRLRYCLTAYPNFGTSTNTLVNQCDVDVAAQLLLGSGNVDFAFPAYVPAWNGMSVAPGQLANNEVVVPRFSWSFSFSYGGPNIAVVQRSKGLPKADEQAFSLF